MGMRINCDCGEPINRFQTMCEECCEHGDQDDYCCLDCGKDMTEEKMARAYDLAKDSKYE